MTAAGWRRSFHSVLRFPALRLVRLVALGAAAGAALAGAWQGTTPLVAAAGVLLYVAGLDAVEPLAQEVDHPDQRDGHPRPAGSVYVSLLGPPMMLMVAVGLVAAGVMAALVGATSAAQTALVDALPAAWCGLAGAAISVVQGPPPLFSPAGSLMPPEIAGVRAVVRLVWPPLVAIVGFLPAMAARHLAPGRSPAVLTASLAVPVLVLLAAVGLWIRYHDDIHRWFRSALSDAGERRPASPLGPLA